jgi:hypothetical protein
MEGRSKVSQQPGTWAGMVPAKAAASAMIAKARTNFLNMIFSLNR